uniref:Ig-like domain-containing protein n=1 Tax=Monodelphis domestica TaxID=13616 RepID=F7B736_MONDO
FSFHVSNPTVLSLDVDNAVSKSILSLNPSWRIFIGENVTLHCEGFTTSGSNQTQWLHNGSSISVQTPTYDITFATMNMSGEYMCQNGDSAFSDPVYLGIYSDWLLLQPSLAIIKEGEPLVLSCHGWKNRTVYKVTYYHNNKALKYWYENHKYYISYATVQNRGYYYCTGILWRIPYTSKPLYIDFKGELKSSDSEHFRDGVLGPSPTTSPRSNAVPTPIPRPAMPPPHQVPGMLCPPPYLTQGREKVLPLGCWVEGWVK